MDRKFIFEPLGGSSLTKFGVNQEENPFCTDAYVAAMEMLGYETWIVGTKTDGGVQDAAIGLLRRGRVSAALEFVSLPPSASQEDFWSAIYADCKRLKVTNLIAGTFGSSPFQLPGLVGEFSRTQRTEYVFSISNGTCEKAFEHDIRRNIRKARSAGLVLRHGSDDPDWLSEHVRLNSESMMRRAARGESVQMSTQRFDEYKAYLRSGAGELFQALQDGKVVSSELILRSAQRAYGQSMGTSSEGMKVGASHFLIFSVCKELEKRGMRTYNLGGAPKGSTLARFKVGFGACEVSPLSTCSCYLGPRWLKKIHSAIKIVRMERRQAWKALVGRV
jgi:lipid II:glycine glycyltransferase (peptidoglycan interpeptide bridge formation enzyme)